MTRQIALPMDVLAERFWPKVAITHDLFGCWLWQAAKNGNGYGVFCVGHQRNYYAHRFSLELALGRPLGPGMLACHRCNTKSCVRPEHLYEGSRVANAQDALRDGRLRVGDLHPMRLHPERRATGERHGSARLTESLVRAIRERSSENQYVLAEEFGVTQTTISQILLGKTWRHVT